MKLSVALTRAFTVDKKGGNPAGVVYLDKPLENQAMQAVAAAVGLSETAFAVLEPNGNVHLQFYTPTKRIANCGHATLGSFALLQERGVVGPGEHSVRNDLGVSRVRLKDERIALLLKKGNHSRLSDPAELLASLGLETSDLDQSLFVSRSSAGVDFFLIGVENGSLGRIKPDLVAIEKLSGSAVGYYVFAKSPSTKLTNVSEWSARMFAPAYGIPEESATGMAAGALGAAFSSEGLTNQFCVLQGQAMSPPSPAELTVEVNQGEIYVQGQAHVEGVREIEI